MYFLFKVEIRINREHLIKQVYKLRRKLIEEEINQFHKCKGIYLTDNRCKRTSVCLCV